MQKVENKRRIVTIDGRPAVVKILKWVLDEDQTRIMNDLLQKIFEEWNKKASGSGTSSAPYNGGISSPIYPMPSSPPPSNTRYTPSWWTTYANNTGQMPNNTGQVPNSAGQVWLQAKALYKR